MRITRCEDGRGGMVPSVKCIRNGNVKVRGAGDSRKCGVVK